MDYCLNLFYTNKPAFLKSIQQGSIELNSLVIGLVLSCNQSDIQVSFDLLEILLLPLTLEKEDLQTAIAIKFLNETQKFPFLHEQELYLGELFCKFSKFLTNLKSSNASSALIAKYYHKAANFILMRFSKSEIFPMILKVLSKNQKFLPNFPVNIDEDTVQIIVKISKTHYLDDLNEFFQVFSSGIQVLKTKNPVEIGYYSEFIAKKLKEFAEFHKTENLNELNQLLDECKKLFIPNLFGEIENLLKGKIVEVPKSTEDSIGKSLLIKVTQKPYTDETPPETEKPNYSFFDSFHFRTHNPRATESPTRKDKFEHKHIAEPHTNTKNLGQRDQAKPIEEPKPEEPSKPSEVQSKISIKVLAKTYDDEEELKNEPISLNNSLSKSLIKSETEVRNQIKRIIYKYKNIFLETGKNLNEDIKKELMDLKESPIFPKTFYLEVKICIQEDNHPKVSQFWETLVEVSKNFIESHQVQAIKRELQGDREYRTGNYNRRGRGKIERRFN